MGGSSINRFNKKTKIAIFIAITLFISYQLHSFYVFMTKPPYLAGSVVTKEFINNREKFESIVRYSETIGDNFVIEKTGKQYEFEVKINGKYTVSKVDDLKVHNDIIYLFNTVGYKTITKYKSVVYFTRETGFKYTHGIIYFGNGKKEYSGIDHMDLYNISELKWFYVRGE